MKNEHNLSSYDYYLPEELIAQNPTIPAHDAKLLIYDQKNTLSTLTTDQAGGKQVKKRLFWDIDDYLPDNTTVFLNNSQVIKARIPLSHVQIINKKKEKIFLESGEIFVYEIKGESEFECLVSDGKNFRPGYRIMYSNDIYFESLKQVKDGILMKIYGISLFDFLDKNGLMPLPPYVSYEDKKAFWYQTEFASNSQKGSVAAPTAGLHFTNKLINKLKNSEKGIDIEYTTLHVGLGTFRTMYEEDITSFDIHHEKVIINKNIFEIIAQKKKRNGHIMSVGTTSCRVLESLPYVWVELEEKYKKKAFSEDVIEFWDGMGKDEKKIDSLDYCLCRDDSYNMKQKKTIHNLKIKSDPSDKSDNIFFDTKIYIYPGFDRKVVDILCTNFHLPKTSLLLLVSSFLGGKKRIQLYEFAKENGFKFYSFGDGMLLFRNRQKD